MWTSNAKEMGGPWVGFILMVDEFRTNNGATRFVPGSHQWPTIPAGSLKDISTDHEGQVVACGPAGSVIVYNSRSLVNSRLGITTDIGALYGSAEARRPGSPCVRARRLRPEARARIGHLAKYVLAV
jgi:hypothetical protein